MKTLSLIIFGMALAVSPAVSQDLKDDTGSSMRDLREFKADKPKQDKKDKESFDIPPDFPLDPFSAICGCNPYFQ